MICPGVLSHCRLRLAQCCGYRSVCETRWTRCSFCSNVDRNSSKRSKASFAVITPRRVVRTIGQCCAVFVWSVPIYNRNLVRKHAHRNAVHWFDSRQGRNKRLLEQTEDDGLQIGEGTNPSQNVIVTTGTSTGNAERKVERDKERREIWIEPREKDIGILKGQTLW